MREGACAKTPELYLAPAISKQNIRRTVHSPSPPRSAVLQVPQEPRFVHDRKPAPLPRPALLLLFPAIHGTVETRITTPQRAEARLVAWPVSLSPLTQYYTFGAISSDPAKSSAHALRDLWIDTQK